MARRKGKARGRKKGHGKAPMESPFTPAMGKGRKRGRGKRR